MKMLVVEVVIVAERSDHFVLYRKWGNIHWAKLLHFSQFSRALRKFSHEYLLILYKLCIMALLKCCKRKALQKFSHEKLHWVESTKV